MVEQHSDTSAVITGHNERVERLWCDVYRCIGVLYHDTFKSLEGEIRLIYFVSTYVFLSLIQQTLNAFVKSWNNHSTSTQTT